jgi:ribosome-binding factor A
MAREFSRTRRVADQIQRELAEIIQMELGDPRLGMITVTAVEVSPEYERARVFFTVLGNQGDIKTTTNILNQAAGYMRSQLAKRIKLRITPVLTFVYDESLEKGRRMDALIKAAVTGDKSGDQ